MPTNHRAMQSDLFLLRFWLEEGEDGATVWRGRLQRAVSGERHQFQSLPNLMELLASLLGKRAGVAEEGAARGHGACGLDE